MPEEVVTNAPEPAAPPAERKPMRDRYTPEDVQEILQHHKYLQRRKWLQIGGVALLFVGGYYISQSMGKGTLINAINKAAPAEVASLAERSPNDAEVQVAAAFRELGEERPQQAFKRMERVVQLAPTNARYWHGLGRAAAACGNAMRSTEAYRKAIELEPRNTSHYFILAQTLFEAGLYSDAFDIFEKIRTMEPDGMKKNHYYSQCLMEVGREKEGIAHLKSVLAEVPLLDNAFPRLARTAIRIGDQQEALEMCRTRLKQSALYWFGDVRDSAVRLILTMHPTKEELADAEKQSRLAVHDLKPLYYAGLAQVLKAEGKWKEAQKAAQDGLDLKADDRECLALLVETAIHNGDQPAAKKAEVKLSEWTGPDRALQPLRDRIKANLKDRAAYIGLAAGLDRAHRPAEASETIHAMLRAIGSDPEAPALLDAYQRHALETLQMAAHPSDPATS